jgi:hypothetical protein
MLENFSLCAGYDLNTDNPACPGFEWDQIVGNETARFGPIFLASIDATDRISAASVISTDPALIDISAATQNLTCTSCFNAFTTDIWQGWNYNSTMRSTCNLDPFSDTCFFDPYVTEARDRFTACSGHQIKPETYDRCTEDEIDEVGTSGISAMIFKHVVSITTTSDIVDYVQTILRTTDGEQIVSSSCSYCYIYFAREIFKLSYDIKKKCLSFNTCAFEQADFDRIRLGFKTCSGFDIAVDDAASQMTSSTQAPFSVTTYMSINIAGGATTSPNSSNFFASLGIEHAFFLIMLYIF